MPDMPRTYLKNGKLPKGSIKIVKNMIDLSNDPTIIASTKRAAEHLKNVVWPEELLKLVKPTKKKK
jgi:hypothetical protein